MLRELSCCFAMSVIFLSSCVEIPDKKTPEIITEKTTISGLVSITAVEDSTVRVFAFGNGDKGVVLAETITQEDGSFSVEFDTHSQPILVEANAGNYLSSSTGQMVTMGNYSLRTLINIEAGERVSLAVTPFTNIAVGLAEYLLSSDSTLQINDVITNSNQQISNFLR